MNELQLIAVLRFMPPNVKGKPVAAKELPMEITGDPQLGLTDLFGFLSFSEFFSN